MKTGRRREYWEIWYPSAGATGLFVARSLIDEAQSVILHSAPDVLSVEVRDEEGRRLARGRDLRRNAESPMCRLRREGDAVSREDIWPGEEDLGSVVILPGGDAGVLREWWHAGDRKEWRWRAEFYNSIR